MYITNKGCLVAVYASMGMRVRRYALNIVNSTGDIIKAMTALSQLRPHGWVEIVFP